MNERYKVLKTCGAKKRMTELKAKHVASVLNGQNPKVQVNAYACEYCHNWHVGRLRNFEGL